MINSTMFFHVLLLQNMEFPSVTVCNLNQFRISKIKYLDEIHDILEDYLADERNKSDGSNFESALDSQNKAFKKKFIDDVNDTHGEDINDDDIDHDEDVGFEGLIYIAASTYTESELMPVGHQFEDMILSCSWKRFNCLTG